MAGDVIDVHLTWDPADWNDTWVKVLNCVSVDGKVVPQLSDEERPSPNDGAYDRELCSTSPTRWHPGTCSASRVLCSASSAGAVTR